MNSIHVFDKLMWCYRCHRTCRRFQESILIVQYWLARTTLFVILFLPSDGFFSMLSWKSKVAVCLPTGQSAGRIGVRTRTWPRRSIWVFRSYLAFPDILFTLTVLLQTANSQYSQYRTCLSHIPVFRLVDNLMLSSHQIVHWPNYKLKPFANYNRDTGMYTANDHALVLPRTFSWNWPVM